MGMVEEVQAYILANFSPSGQWIDPNVDNKTGNIFTNFLPESSPDRSCLLVQLPGSAPQKGLGGTIMWYNPRLQVVNRTASLVNSGGYDVAKLDASKIRDLLLGVVNKFLSGTWYLEIKPDGEPMAESLDPSSRPLVTTEYTVMKYFSE